MTDVMDRKACRKKQDTCVHLSLVITSLLHTPLPPVFCCQLESDLSLELMSQQETSVFGKNRNIQDLTVTNGIRNLVCCISYFGI